MKVGIITFHHTTNFGATLQTYGLWKAIKNQGHKVEIIDYRPASATQYYRERIINPISWNFDFLPWLKLLLKYFFPGLAKYIKMRLFLISELNLSEKKFINKEQLKSFLESTKNYDAIVCGSDQIWCINSIRGFDTSYFLDFVNNNCRKLSYAASLGPADSFEEHCEYISKLIRDFDNVSVRDSNSLNLIRQNCGISAVKVLDPTFLVNYQKVFNLRKNPINKEYLLLYIEKIMNSQEIEFIQFLAKKRNLTIISIGEPCYIANKTIVNLSPTDWLSYFNHASYVITNFYHGTIFSIKFNKQFTTLARKSKLNKTGDLLNDLGLSNRFVSNIQSNLFEQQLKEINYDIIGKKLETEISKSKTYLSDALNGNQYKTAPLSTIGTSTKN
ncbi:Polysaccharide pyruvyl transferase [Hyella patelloides LEGE 07179]|uniref:Polysaccharide pyruvyl transferase n=1 Tax=Hyella patelloides LEGE 07179 TaxID=945734 RepID=A0A563VLA8_9CYAN|nr:polysaccharide pyruvyl transferase family protein [Hyella patelloides]VEP12236.1 Polysaccharide pyruvyl transferase [Hyella patelloides LEGE 07179]